MGTYLSPGVYIEEQDTGPEPIEGVSTSVTGFVGVTQSGPLDTNPPVLVTSFPEYQRTFGSYFTPTFTGSATSGDTYNLMPHAVAGFFNNGGQLLYVKRVGSAATPPATAWVTSPTTGNSHLENAVTGPTMMTRLTSTAVPGTTTLQLASLRGLQNGTILTLTQVKNGVTSTSGPLTVASYNDQQKVVTLTAALPIPTPTAANYDWLYTTVALTGNAAFVPAPNTSEFLLSAANAGLWGNTVQALGNGILLQITPSWRTQSQASAVGSVAPGTNNLITLNSSANFYAGAIIEFNTGGDYTITGSVTSGVFVAGEQVVQATSGAAGNLIGTVTGTNPMSIGQLTGTPDAADVWKGQTSGAVYTPTAAPASTYTVTGSVTSGTFTAGEQVVQTTSGAKANLIGTVTGSNPMVISPPTGTPDATDTWVGGTSGAIYTPTSAPVNTAKFYAKVLSITGSSISLVNGLSGAHATAITNNLSANIPVTVRTCEFDIAASYGNVTESFRGLTLDNTTPYYFATTIENGSALLSVPFLSGVTPPTLPSDQTTQDPSTMPVAPDGLNVVLSGGSDGAYPLPSDFAGTDNGPGNRTGITSLIDASEISIIATPGITDQTTQMALITQCETLKYRFAILDPAPSATGGTPAISDIQAQRNLYDTYYAAIYYPRVVVSDPLTGNPLTVAPSGHMAGIYAQTDASRGVWKAPANIVINGILSLEIKLSKGDQDILNPEPSNINALRDFTAQGRGLRVYGARCITSNEEWKYINVRRLFIFIEASLDQGTQWAVFEPNDQTLWNRLIQSVSSFLTTIWHQGGLMGATADQAFFVKCGYDTMSTDDIENGRLIMLVGVAPVFPAEFVIIRIGQWAGGSSVQEL